MIKKISSRVLRSVPLGKASHEFPRIRQFTALSRVINIVSAENFRLRRTSDFVTYTDRLVTSEVFIDNTPTGQSLDCYI